MKMIILLTARIFLILVILSYKPLLTQASSEQFVLFENDERIANDLYKRLAKGGEISAIEKLALLGEKGNVYAIGALRTYTLLDRTDFQESVAKALIELNPEIYAQRVAEGDTQAVYALFNLANSMNSKALQILRHLPLNKFIELASNGNEDVVFLFCTYLNSGQFGLNAREFFEKVDPVLYIEKARKADKAAVFLLAGLAQDGNTASHKEILSLAAEGNEDAVQALKSLIYTGDTQALDLLISLAKQGKPKPILELVDCKVEKAQQAARGIDPSQIIKQAKEGGWEDLRSLYQLANVDNVAAKQAMKTLDPIEFKKQAIEGKEDGLAGLWALCQHGNQAACKISKDLEPQSP